MPNFLTVENPAGGATTISTKTKTRVYATNLALNDQITVKQAKWTLNTDLTTSGLGGQIIASVVDGSGVHHLKDGDRLREPDGTVISYENGGIAIGQRLTWGGSTLTQIKAYTAGGQSGLDVGVIGKGDAVLSGTTAQQAAGSDAALIYSCKRSQSTYTGIGWQYMDGSNVGGYNGTHAIVNTDTTGFKEYGVANL